MRNILWRDLITVSCFFVFLTHIVLGNGVIMCVCVLISLSLYCVLSFAPPPPPPAHHPHPPVLSILFYCRYRFGSIVAKWSC